MRCMMQPLTADLLTFSGLVLILPCRRGSLKVPEGCAKSFGVALDGASKPLGHLAVCGSSCLLVLLRGSRLATGRLLARFASFHIDPGGAPSCQ
ncbi:hypothetical protein EDC04DRAFT_2826634 [Pisolithus marmoratus]|nr:hypothetical protein EDC04DRAFT_2826634 [Pisolithus marmoratus]